MMRVLLTDPLACTDEFDAALQALSPDVTTYRWPNQPADGDYDILLAWRLPPDVRAVPPTVRAIFCFGAGADHLVADPRIPRALPIVRLVDREQAAQLLDYAAHIAFARLNDQARHRRNQEQGLWSLPAGPKPSRRDIRITVLGLGPIGQAVAKGLSSLGFSVAGWSRSRHSIAGVETFLDRELQKAVAGADVLINLLPLAPETERILDYDLFSHLSPGAYIGNLGRGGHLNEQGLRQALDRQQVSAAWLDAFDKEPLPAEHWFWSDHRIHITPHIGGLPTASGAAESLAAVIDALRNHTALPGLVRAENSQN